MLFGGADSPTYAPHEPHCWIPTSWLRAWITGVGESKDKDKDKAADTKAIKG